MARKIVEKELKVKDLDPRVLKCMARIADHAWHGDEAYLQGTDQRRFRIIQAFLDGEAKSLRADAKGNAELATDGQVLTCYGEYTVARKRDDKVILINNQRFQYIDPCGNFKQKNIISAVRYWLYEVATDYKYRCYIISAPLSFPEDAPLTMDCYMTYRAEEAFAMQKNTNWWSPRWIQQVERMWGGSYRESALRVLRDASALGVKVPETEYSSLQDIEECVPKGMKWVKSREVIRYWLAHGGTFTEEDEAFMLRKPSVPLCIAYQIVGGKAMVVPKNPKFMWYWVTQPDRQLEELSPYISYPAADKKRYTSTSTEISVNPVETYIKHRLQGKLMPMHYYDTLDG
ncbi:MAG: hypothetical protein GF334_13815 [Candidatus Altiarchaeales archaeon]|nr:hypothetical protein [Candidatus Altiarchaeales archaeon]